MLIALVVEMVTDTEVKKLGAVVVQVPGTGLGREVTVQLCFGQSTLEVKCFAVATPETPITIVLELAD